MSIETEDTIILAIQRSAHAAKTEVDAMTKEIQEAESNISALHGKLAKSAEKLRESLDYLALHHPEGTKKGSDWFKDMGADREALLKMETHIVLER